MVLRMFLYLFQMFQSRDRQLPLDLARYFLFRYNEGNNWSFQILWTDEPHFSLIVKVNSKNCFHWAYENSHDMKQTPLHEAKLTVWCGLINIFVLGLYLFEGVIYTGM